MGIQLKREKKRDYLLTLLYRLTRIRLRSPKKRLGFFLKLEWIFHRLAHEESFRFYAVEEHPVRINSMNFLSRHIRPSDNIFDLGTKHGELAAQLALQAAHVTGVDIDASHIAVAKENYSRPNLEFTVQDARSFLAENKRHYDVLILSHILEHLDEPEQFLSEIVRYFSTVYIEVPDFEAGYSNSFRKAIGATLIYTDNDHVSEFDREELTALIANSGLEIVDSEFRFGVQKYWCNVKK